MASAAAVHRGEFHVVSSLFRPLDARIPSRIVSSDDACKLRQNYDLSVSEAPKLFSDADFEAVKRIQDGLKVLVLRKRLQVSRVLVARHVAVLLTHPMFGETERGKCQMSCIVSIEDVIRKMRHCSFLWHINFPLLFGLGPKLP